VSSCNILALSGGGVFASFEAGVIGYLAERNHTWDLLTGVSAGGINAGFISSIPSGEEKNHVNQFKQLWTSLKNDDIYTDSYFLNGMSIYDNAPLKKTFDKVYGNIEPIRPVKISATSLKKGLTEIFTEDDIRKYGFTNVLMSSTAIPLLFPPYQFNDDIFVDGGLTSNLLVNEGIDFCLDNFPNENVYIDVIVCGVKIREDTSLQYHFKEIVNRLILIIMEQLEYSEILHSVLEENIFITVYEQKDEQGINVLDFTAAEKLWYQGYNFTNVNVYWINTTTDFFFK